MSFSIKVMTEDKVSKDVRPYYHQSTLSDKIYLTCFHSNDNGLLYVEAEGLFSPDDVTRIFHEIYINKIL